MIVIVPCGDIKASHTTTAENMYIGKYHKFAMRYARHVAPRENIYILSAKHGLMMLDKVIEPYNLKMGDLGSIGAYTIRQQAIQFNILNESVIALGGKKYSLMVKHVWPSAQTPLIGLSMTKHYTWFYEQIQRSKSID